MLQRAASNAYSWWWASHIRTKQSKWLEQSLQDMEEKVQGMIKLIEEDGDSFAKRAEMYYKRRPELINFVEEAFKSFRSLADRYDHLSKDLQNANNTIAQVFPEQVQLMAELDDDSPKPKLPKKKPTFVANAANVPKVPKAPSKDLKGIFTTASKKIQAKKKSQNRNKLVPKSGLTKDQAVKEIDKLQKDILSMQTVKEYVKSSYESGVAKYWDIENQIVEMQQKVCSLQDEFNVDSVIEDSEARTLMAEAALKSCQETLTQLEQKQERSTTEAREEYKKIEAVCQRLKSLKSKFFPGFDEKNSSPDDQSVNTHASENSVGIKTEKSKRHSDLGDFTGSLTVTELAEKIDELVNKVIGLETDVSSQTILINTLRTETDELNTQIQNLENEKDTLIGDKKDLSNGVIEMEEKLAKIQILNKSVERETSNLQTEFVETSSSLGHLKDKLSSTKPDEDLEETDTISPSRYKLLAGPEYQKDVSNPAASKIENREDVKEVVVMNIECPELLVQEEREETDKPNKKEVTVLEQKLKEEVHVAMNVECPELLVQEKREESDKPIKNEDKLLEQKPKEEVHVAMNVECPALLVQEKRVEADKPIQKGVTCLEQKPEVHVAHEHDPIISDDAQGGTDKQQEQERNMEQVLSTTETDDRDRIPLKEYTMILRNYKDVKKKLSELQKKDRDSQFDITLQLREQKKAIQKRDEVIQRLLDKLNLQKRDMKADESDVYEDLEVNEALDTPMSEKAEEIDSVFVNNQSISIVEEKLRMDIDAILDENLDFWLRFSTAFHQIQKFRTEVQDLQDEIEKLKEKKKQEGSSAAGGLKSEARPIYKHLREIQTELTVWLEQSVSLKDELKRRFASLCNIQEEITKALKKGAEEDEISFSSHQAAKFQGEILNMKQENNKVREELNAGLDHVSTLQLEIDKTLKKMTEEFDICDDQYELKGRSTKVPLRSFIFGTKKKQKPSIFSCMHPNKTYQILRAGIPRQITLD